MSGDFILVSALIVCIGGLIVFGLMEKYNDIISQVLWYFLCMALVQLTVMETIPTEEEKWAASVVVGAAYWITYIALSIYVAIKTTIDSKSVLIPLAFLAVMNLIFMFIMVEKEISNGLLSFSVADVIRYSLGLLACQLVIIVITDNVRNNT